MQRLIFYKRFIPGFLLTVTFFLLSVSAYAVDLPAYRLFVARFMDSDLVIMNSSTGEETGKVKFDFAANPSDLVLSPDGKNLYVSNRGTDEIALVDVKSGSLKRRVKVGVHPHFMALSPDGKYLVVANNQDDNATILNKKSLAIVGRPRIGRGASGAAVTDDSRFAYIPSMYTNYISVIDLEKMERVSKIELYSPIFIVIPRGSNFAYICSHADRVSIIDLRTNKVVGAIPAGSKPNHIRLSKDGHLIFVANMGSASITVIDLEKRKAIKEIAVGFEPTSSGLSPDGKILFVVNYGEGSTDGSISVIDVKELKEIERIKFYRYPRAVAVLPAE